MPAIYVKSYTTRVSIVTGALLLFMVSHQAFAQTSVPSAGLQRLGFISIPNWATSGPNQASFDVPAFNRATGVMYLADRVNRGATAIDTRTLTYLGTIQPPNCPSLGASCPSGALIAPDLQKLIITSRSTVAWIYDLRVPGQAPVTLTVPNGSDELDYDPINQRAYIGNTVSPFFVTVVDMNKGAVLGSIPLAESPEQPRWNPVDGLIYVNVPDQHVVVEIDPQQGPFGAVINGLSIPNGCANAIDIDPVTDTAMLGCSSAPNQILDLRTGATLQTFPQISGVDIGLFNPHNRRWYMGARNRTDTLPCSKDTAGRWAFLAVVSNAPQGGQFIGGECTGLGGKETAVDPILNNIFVPVQQFPPDPNDASTGSPGILVYHDPAPPFTGTPANTEQAASQANLTALSGSGVAGTAGFTLRRRNMAIDATLTGLPAGSRSVWVVVETSVGHETIPCGVDNNGRGFCSGYVLGDPLLGAPANVASNGNRVASGTIVLTITFPTFIAID